MMKIIILFMALLLTLTFSYDYNEMKTDAIFYVGLATFLTFSGLVVAYLIGKASNNVQIIGWINVESANIIISIILTLIILTGFISINEAIENVYGSDMFTISFGYIDSLVNEALDLAVSNTKDSVLDQYKTTDYMFIGTPMTSSGGCGKSYRGFYMAYAQHKEMVVDLLTTAAISLQVQKYILYAITSITLTFFLPIGLMLRIIPKLRPAGNFMIALAFALGIIYPATYVLHNEMHNQLFAGGTMNINFNDEVFSNDMLEKMALIFPQAYFFPNITFIIVGAFVAGMYRALDGIKV